MAIITISTSSITYANNRAVFWLKNRLNNTPTIVSVAFSGALDESFSKPIVCIRHNTGLPKPGHNLDFLCNLPNNQIKAVFGKMSVTLSNGTTLKCHLGGSSSNELIWFNNGMSVMPNVARLMNYNGQDDCLITVM